MLTEADLAPPPAVIEFANKNNIKNLKKNIIWSEPFALRLYKCYNEVYLGKKQLSELDKYSFELILVKISDGKIKEIRLADPKEWDELINYPLPPVEQLDLILQDLHQDCQP